MKKIILLGTTILLFSFLTLIPGCGCQEQKNQEEKTQVNTLDPNFKGPDSAPHSIGPTEPPPSN